MPSMKKYLANHPKQAQALCANTAITNPFREYLQTKINDMRLNLAKILGCETSLIGIKSSTYQKTGIIGNNQGIACYVNILINK